MSTCTLASGCDNCKASIEANLIWCLRNKSAAYIQKDPHMAFNLEAARTHGSPELQALIVEKGV